MKQKLIVIVKGGSIQGVFSTKEMEKVDIEIIDYDVNMLSSEDERRRLQLEKELKTMVQI